MRIAFNKKLFLFGRHIDFSLGKNGITSSKKEGDYKTPIGKIRPVMLFYRPDRVRRPQSPLPTYPIVKKSGWCDDPDDIKYNHYVNHPYRASAEALMRQEQAYDYIIVTDYNYPKAKKNKGSAIFIHLVHEDQRPTAGCIAFNQNIMRRLLSFLTKTTEFHIVP